MSILQQLQNKERKSVLRDRDPLIYISNSRVVVSILLLGLLIVTIIVWYYSEMEFNGPNAQRTNTAFTYLGIFFSIILFYLVSKEIIQTFRDILPLQYVYIYSIDNELPDIVLNLPSRNKRILLTDYVAPYRVDYHNYYKYRFGFEGTSKKDAGKKLLLNKGEVLQVIIDEEKILDLNLSSDHVKLFGTSVLIIEFDEVSGFTKKKFKQH